nr:unnamed protein product [Callosobruchus analis]
MRDRQELRRYERELTDRAKELELEDSTIGLRETCGTGSLLKMIFKLKLEFRISPN